MDQPVFSNALGRWLCGKPDWVRASASLPLHDTHEHLQTEADHLAADPNPLYLLCQYLPTDLIGAGMDRTHLAQITREGVAQRFAQWEEDFARLAPYLPEVAHTGYGQMVARTLDIVFGETELTLPAMLRISQRMRTDATPGVYDRLLGGGGICSTQTNSFDGNELGRLPVRRVREAAWHLKDLFIDPFLVPQGLAPAEQEMQLEAVDLARWLELVQRYFAQDAAQCVAVKCAVAYLCDLSFPNTAEAEAAQAYDVLRHRRDTLAYAERAAAEFAFRGWAVRRLLELARQHDLPVKFHTGHYAGPTQPLHRISANLANLQPLIEEHLDVTFILMHHAYPYGDAAATLAKAYERVYVDQCWTWAINPAAAVRYLKEFLTVAPASKLFLFGGDLWRCEPVLGHADLARHGLALTLSQLVDEGWLQPGEALPVAERLCHLNQEQVFPQLRPLRMQRGRSTAAPSVRGKGL